MKARPRKILKLLLDSESHTTAAYLSKLYHVSERTIRNDITQINDYLNKYHCGKVRNIRNVGLTLDLPKKLKKQIFKDLQLDNSFYYGPDERELDIILNTSIGKQPVFLNKKMEEFDVSKSTIDEDMRRIRSYFNEYDIGITSLHKEGLVLQGDERIIRTVIYRLVSRHTINREYEEIYPIGKIVQKYINKESIDKINAIYDKNFSDTEENFYRKYLILFTYIFMMRIKKGFYIEERFSNDSQFNRYLEDVSEEFNFRIIESEKNYFEFMMNSLIKDKEDFSFDWIQVQMFSLRLIKYVEMETNIPFTKKEGGLQRGIYNHLISMIPRIQNNIQFHNPLEENIKKSYGKIFYSIKIFFDNNMKFINYTISDGEIGFLAIHFSAALSEINQENEYWFRAAVICNHGVATGRLLAENLKELFNVEILAVLNSRELQLIEKLDIDLVFSTVEIEYSLKPLLVVEPIITENSKVIIENFLEENDKYKKLVHRNNDYTKMFLEVLTLIESYGVKIYENDYFNIKEIFDKNLLPIKVREIRPLITDMLSEKFVRLNIEVKDWEGAIREVSDLLLNENRITQSYIESMVKNIKEYGPYIVLGPHLALAHARPEDGAKKLGLSVITLKKPIEFNHEVNDPVRIIFCLSAVDSYSHLEIMKNLIKIINEEGVIKSMYESKNYNDFINIIRKVEEK